MICLIQKGTKPIKLDSLMDFELVVEISINK